MKALAESFVAAINSGQVEAIVALMTADHVFIDSQGNRVNGSGTMRDAWTNYLSMMPDYHITVDRILCEGDVFVVVGRACGTYAPDGIRRNNRRWDIPACWQGRVRENRIAEWQIFCDHKAIYDMMNATATER